MADFSDHDQWHEYVWAPTGARVRVDDEVRARLGEQGAWEAHKRVRLKNLPVRPLGAPMGTGCFLTVNGVELFAAVWMVAGPPDEPVVHLATKERVLRWRAEQEQALAAKKGGRLHKQGPAPVPELLHQVAIVRFRYGGQIQEIACTACTLRDVKFAKSMELPCLHCLGTKLADVPAAGPIAARTFLVPAQYVLGITAGPHFQMGKLPADGKDVQCFEPREAPLTDAMPLTAIKAALAALFEPELN